MITDKTKKYICGGVGVFFGLATVASSGAVTYIGAVSDINRTDQPFITPTAAFFIDAASTLVGTIVTMCLMYKAGAYSSSENIQQNMVAKNTP